MSARVAQKCFTENHNLFSHPQGTPERMEKFNLYNGLANLADELQELQRHVAALYREIQQLRR